LLTTAKREEGERFAWRRPSGRSARTRGREVVSGFLIGGAVSASVLRMARVRHPSLPVWLPAGVAFWLAITPVQAPASLTHDMMRALR